MFQSNSKAIFPIFVCIVFCQLACSRCPDKFIQLLGKCYYFSEQQTTWQEAYNQCALKRATLLGIETAQEALAINVHLNYERANTNYWTSGTDAAEEGSFVWLSSGKRFTYTAWCPTQPDNAHGGEHYVHLTVHSNMDRCWNDEKNNRTFRFICEEYHGY